MRRRVIMFQRIGYNGPEMRENNMEGRDPSDNYTYNELRDLAVQFKELQ